MLYPSFIKCCYGLEVNLALSQIVEHAQYFSKHLLFMSKYKTNLVKKRQNAAINTRKI